MAESRRLKRLRVREQVWKLRSAFAVAVLATVTLTSIPVDDLDGADRADAPVTGSPISATSTGVAAIGIPSADGYRISLAGRTGVRRTITLRPDFPWDGEWVGYHCQTSDGSHIAAVVAPSWFGNDPTLRDRGAFAYSVDLADGDVTPLVSGVALKYHSPGCGATDSAAFVRHLGTDQEQSDVLRVDLTTGGIVSRHVVAGQVTSAVPGAGASDVYAARDKGVVKIDRGAETIAAVTPGVPFRLRPARAGGVQFLTSDNSATVAAWDLAGGRLTPLGRGTRGRIDLWPGAPDNVLVNGTSVAAAARVRTVAASLQPLAVSPDGGVVAVPRTGTATSVDVLAGGVAVDEVSIGTAATNVSAVAPLPLPAPLTGGLQSFDGAAPRPIRLINHSPGGPGCAIPRNSANYQVPQPNATQINWAIEQGVRNNLKGSVLTRPANYANLGLVAYQPSVDFPRNALAGASSSSVPIPPSVPQAVYAQESAWRHASFRALPGVSGNPLVGDFYGAGGTLDVIDYTQSDCGYGLSQVTEPMTANSHTYSFNGKKKVAIDYAENVAAGLQFLVDKWNQLYNANVRLNDGDVTKLENWYFATWAYNSGFHPVGEDTAGRWGLGWTNNPRNADWKPDRDPFLRYTYGDAAHPGDWPYPEKVSGWMGTPILDYRGRPSYSRPAVAGQFGYLAIPDENTFCVLAKNNCDPAWLDGPPNQWGIGDLSFCKYSDRKCWWHDTVTYVASCSTNCAVSSFVTSTNTTEPTVSPGSSDDNYPPACQVDLGAEPGAAVVIVDDLPQPLNVEGCSPTWQTAGTFQITYGTNSNGQPTGQIDYHQLGTGLGGHTFFTKNRLPGDTAHINRGVWRPTLPATGWYRVLTHVPVSGASTPTARYVVDNGLGVTTERVVDVHLHKNTWVPLGTFQLAAGASVALDNVTAERTPGTTNVPFDAVAFVQMPGGVDTVRRISIDVAQIFDPDQNIDSSSGTLETWLGDTIFESEARLKEWATKLIDGTTSESGVLDYLPCVPGTPTTGQCVPLGTRGVFERWGLQVRGATAGAGAVPPAQWLNFANTRRPPAVLPAGYFDDPEHSKTHMKLDVEFAVKDGAIVSGSERVFALHHNGNTLMPTFMFELFQALEADYGVARPNLTYDVENLATYSHANSTATPHLDAIMPGRQFRGDADIVAANAAGCVGLRGVTGGMIGWKPMLNEGHVHDEVVRWRDDIRTLRSNGRLPAVLRNAVDSIEQYFFSARLGEDYEGSPFRKAPPIWSQVNARICPDGTVKPFGNDASTPWTEQFAYSSLMPDLYVWVNGALVDNAAAPAAGPIQQGNFDAFSRIPIGPVNVPWYACNFYELPLRAGNPWDIGFIFDGKDKGNDVTYCDRPDDPYYHSPDQTS